MSKSGISQNTAKQAVEFLQALPTKEPDVISARAFVAANTKTIEGALARGYSHNEVATLLTQKFTEIQISGSTLKKYLGEVSSTHPKKSKRKRTAKNTAQKQPAPAATTVTDAAHEPHPTTSGPTADHGRFVDMPDEL
jgi:hypothetical protein